MEILQQLFQTAVPILGFAKDDTPVLMLTAREFVILQYLMRNPNAVVTRSMIEAHAWDYDFDSISNLVDVYIRQIRQKN
ncbi:transcriptional regulatory protein (DNA-binding response regulator) [Desulforapulum autotrophicum HRM2]|uniref:Transcriptional regulatory protein (DNA-binding response regulator) n=1 Tax=Desulforapulum autotrophicum (strain ATCC 43914 / DSM 3382 / VKM B-1955 / HRM2) TaxID=177437 RepID=C0QED5_DESAH|nr:winged helix-turn-helix domain-containing protein [Desulforapulum autotrophicum]ACN13252.1 transcriptional regulatory protein (DNA-binding response regulator) [Desulforapulum autotrophicum HRM2]